MRNNRRFAIEFNNDIDRVKKIEQSNNCSLNSLFDAVQ